MTVTEASHPAVLCSKKDDSVVCISSTTTGTGLVAVGTEQGHLSIWELDRGLLIMVCICTTTQSGVVGAGFVVVSTSKVVDPLIEVYNSKF